MAKDFLPQKGAILQEYLVYFKKAQCICGGKDLPDSEDAFDRWFLMSGRSFAATRVVPQRFAPLSLDGDKARFCFSERSFSMNCPKCGKRMEEGYLSSKSPVFWSEHVSGLTFPARKGDIILGKALGILRPKAFLCRDCHKVIIDY